MARPHRTAVRKKVESSIVFTVEVLFFSLPVYLLTDSFFVYRLFAILLCFIYVLSGMIREGTFLSMLIVGEKWERKHYAFRSYLTYSALYTASFSTLLFYMYFPFDLLLINLLCVQLPMVLFTGTTLHGFLSGNIASTDTQLRRFGARALMTRLKRRKVY